MDHPARIEFRPPTRAHFCSLELSFIGRSVIGERHYRGYYDYAGPRFYSERRYHRGPHVIERHSYRWRGRDWD
jgi:hypothetical protein